MAEQKKKYNSSSRNSGGSNNQGNNRNRNQDSRNSNSRRPSNQAPQSNSEQSKPQSQSKTESSNDLLFFIIFLVCLAGFFLAKKFYFPPNPVGIYGAASNIDFMKEGKLSFRDAQSDAAIISIDIEIAKTNYEIEQGLMYRKSLPANAGMLFIFPEENYRTFWMKNTFLSLDIIFLNAEKEIIRICKNAEPLSEVSIPSGGKAQYIVEVLGGFTDAYQIHIGDRIIFQ